MKLPHTPPAVFIGRTLAGCCHPVAAWRSFSKPERISIALGYFAAGFVSVLSVLLYAR